MATTHGRDVHIRPVMNTTAKTAADYVWAVARISIGWVFLWAFLDKAFGWGFATPITGE
jgi:thiosulfate dehydrogenase (quinone) large subunit